MASGHYSCRFGFDPAFSVKRPHEWGVVALVVLKDDSIVSCAHDYTAKRWSKSLQPLGTYKGHERWVLCAAEKEDNATIVTGSVDRTIKVWNTTTCECLTTLDVDKVVNSILKTRSKRPRFVCGLAEDTIQIRRVNDLGLISSFKLEGSSATKAICELEDGSFVSVSNKALLRWNGQGRMLQEFHGHQSIIYKVIELTRGVLVSSSVDQTAKMWKASTGELLHTFSGHTDKVCGLVKLKDGLFATGSVDRTIRVWNDKGDCTEVRKTNGVISALAMLRDGSILSANENLFEIRQRASRLVDMCCATILNNKDLFNLEELNRTLPQELSETMRTYGNRCLLPWSSRS